MKYQVKTKKMYRTSVISCILFASICSGTGNPLPEYVSLYFKPNQASENGDSRGYGQAIANTDLMAGKLPSMTLARFKDSVYYFAGIFKGNHYQATQLCKYHNMDLVSIETKEENDFLYEYMTSFYGNTDYIFWTSGSIDNLSDWIWMGTGKPIIFANWFPKQPDNAGNNEKYLEVNYSLNNKGLMWNDRISTFQNYAICELTVPKSVSEVLANIVEI
ncbi:perlucin-like isoform X1 [Diorhabda sublineata]|uniref:perlucin-like isoform X1 n=1 Tax=Diorhabda sublineata TaxID=1163346 RepID=UPI0024E0BF2D|nr:perlucin-like isoform X1 [Diorhabda sublineata]